MEEEKEARLIIYHPRADADHPILSLPSSLAGIKVQTQLDNERTAVLTFDSQCEGSADRVKSYVASVETDVYVSGQLSSNVAVCLVRVEGMVCTSCVQLIETTLPKREGVHGVKVSLSGNEAMAEFDPALTSAQDIASAIDDMGFEAEILSTHTYDTCHLLTPNVHKTVVIGVEGMVCQSCVLNIHTNVTKVTGVKNIAVSLADKSASITYDPSLVSVGELCSAIEELGFGATCPDSGEMETTSRGACCTEGRGEVRRCFVGIEGMTCHSCVSLIESVVGGLEGVVNVTVTLATKEGVVEYEVGLVGEEEIRAAIEDTGFEVTTISGECWIKVSSISSIPCGYYFLWLTGFSGSQVPIQIYNMCLIFPETYLLHLALLQLLPPPVLLLLLLNKAFPPVTAKEPIVIIHY